MTAPAHGPQEIPLAPFPSGAFSRWSPRTAGARCNSRSPTAARRCAGARCGWSTPRRWEAGSPSCCARSRPTGSTLESTPLGGGRRRPGVLRITKRIHNLLHGYPGDDGQLGSLEQRVYERALEPARVWLERRLRVGDVVVLHDPQTAGRAPALKAAGAHVVCRSHVGAEPGDALAGATRDFLRT